MVLRIDRCPYKPPPLLAPPSSSFDDLFYLAVTADLFLRHNRAPAHTHTHACKYIIAKSSSLTIYHGIFGGRGACVHYSGPHPEGVGTLQ